MKIGQIHTGIGALARVSMSLVIVLGVVALWTLMVSPDRAAAQGPIVLDGVAGAGEWDPTWRVATDPLDVTITGTGNHPHDPPTYARSGYDATALWAHYDVAGATWYFRTDVDGRPADSDSQTGTPGNLGVGTHDVDGGPLGGDSPGIGPPEAYRLRFQYQGGGPISPAELGGDSTILPGVLASTTAGLTGQGVYSTTFNPGVIEWGFARDVIVPAGSNYRELWMGAQMGDNSDRVSDDEVPAVLVIALDQVAGCPAAPAVIGQQATFPVNYGVPAAAGLGVNDVVLTVDVPAGTTFISASNGGTESGGVITWNLGNLSPGAAGQVTFVLRIDDTALTSLIINSEMTCAEGLRYQSRAECPVQQPPPALNVTVNCPATSIVVGSQATFPLDYGIPASSISGATNVVLTADVPAGTTFISASSGGTHAGGVITWNLGNLSPGDAGQVTFVLRVDASMTSLTINSGITCDEGISDQDSAVCPVQQPTALSLAAKCPANPIVVGGRATFPLDYGVSASGTSGVTNAVLTANVPAGTTFVKASDGGTESGGVITWNLGNLSPGDDGQVSFTLRVNASMTSITIHSEITCDEGFQRQATNECPVGPKPPTVIPESSSLLLLGSGLATLAALAGLARARLRR